MTPSATLTVRPTALPRSAGSPDELAGTVGEGLVLIVSPCNGRFRPVAEEVVDEGGLVAEITGGRSRRDAVRAPVDLEVHGLVAMPGHLVVTGQALAWGRVRGATA